MLKVVAIVLATVLNKNPNAFQIPVSSPFVGSAGIASCSSSLPNRSLSPATRTRTLMSMSAQVSSVNSSWGDLKAASGEQAVGGALNQEVELRKTGNGSAHVQSNLRLFGSEEKPKITLYRDHAGWCPYCQKTMLLIEEKQVPINIELVPMRSYGDKPTEFTRMVPGGLLPAITVERENGQKQAITESSVIMELLDQWHPASEGYKPMLPEETDAKGVKKFNELSQLERELFSWWCTLMFRPEGPNMSAPGIMSILSGKKETSGMSGAMKGFLDCIGKVDKELTSTDGPWFFDKDYPTMIDFVFVSHVERMLASCAYWKGLNLRDDEMRKKFPGLNNWLDSFDKRECFLAYKSDYYTHIKDIPPQYGPSYNGGFEAQREIFSKMIDGTDGESWVLPLPHDDPIQPLYRGPPLSLCVLSAAGIEADADGTYEGCDPDTMARACRQFAGWKIAGNGNNVSRFAARGGKKGARNQRKTFGAELADPYADPDDDARPHVDAALRVVCEALLDDSEKEESHISYLQSLEDKLRSSVPSDKVDDVLSSLAYLRDRTGVPRDMPLAAARQFRAHLNWAIRTL